MSGGSLSYFYLQLQEHIGDFGDEELDDLVKDLADLFMHVSGTCLQIHARMIGEKQEINSRTNGSLNMGGRRESKSILKRFARMFWTGLE